MHILSTFRERTDGPWSHVFDQEKRQEKKTRKINRNKYMYTCTAEPQGKRNFNEYFPRKRKLPTFYPVSKNKEDTRVHMPSNEMKLKYIVF